MKIRALVLSLLLFAGLSLYSPLCQAAYRKSYGYWYPGMHLAPALYQPNWDALTHIVYGGAWNMDASGGLTPPSADNLSAYALVRDAVHSRGKRMLVCVFSGSTPTIEAMTANAAARETLADNVVAVIQANGADGVEFDLEFAQNAANFEEFAKVVYARVKAADPAWDISYAAGFLAGGDAFYNADLQQYVDALFLMAYDFHWPEAGKPTGALSPFSDPTYYDINEMIDAYLGYYDPDKLIAGLPLYGSDWAAASDQAGAAIISGEGITTWRSTTIDHTAQYISDYGRLWDANSHTPWYRYQESGVWRQIWMDDAESLRLKYDYIKSKNLGGVGFFALGFEALDPAIWDNFTDLPHALTVTGGTGTGSYYSKQTITVAAGAPAAGKIFDRWTGDTGCLADPAAAATVATMPGSAVSVTAVYKDISSLWDGLNDAWYDTNCLYRKAIIINHTRVANTDQTDFPVLISIADPDLRATVNGGKVRHPSGYDIVFTGQSGAVLSWEVESYDPVTGNLIAWVKVPVLSHLTDTVLYVYYGNASVKTSQENRTAVWDGNFRLVQHMNAVPAADGSPVPDSSGYGNNGTAYGMAAANSVGGPVGKGLSFDGSNDSVNQGHDGNIDLSGTAVSIGFWLKPAARNVYTPIMEKLTTDWSSVYSGWSVGLEATNKLRLWLTFPGAVTNFEPNSVLQDTGWKYIVYTYDGAAVSVYLDGTLDRTIPETRSIAPNPSKDLNIGTSQGSYFHGSLDEVRLSSIARSADWIRTEYNNQSSPSTFLSLAGEEAVPGPDQQQIPPDPEQRRVRAWPNPADFSKISKTTIRYTVPDASSVFVGIYTVAGELVKTLVDNAAEPAGAYTVDWQGDTDAGRRISSGVYLYIVRTGKNVRRGKIAVMK